MKKDKTLEIIKKIEKKNKDYWHKKKTWSRIEITEIIEELMKGKFG